MNSLNVNLSALTTGRRLNDASRDLGRTAERLSSGLRIVHASDDAAGLAISTGLRSDSRVFNQGIRNLNDGMSLLEITDGALQQLSTIVMRITELSEQAANGTLGSVQRQALNLEASALRDEYNRIRASTKFNGLSLLDGGVTDLSLQAGYGNDERLTFSFGLAGLGADSLVGDGTFGAAAVYAGSDGNTRIELVDLNNDGRLDILSDSYIDGTISVSLGNGDGTFKNRVEYSGAGSTFDPQLGDFNSDGVVDVATAAFAGGISIFYGNSNGSFTHPDNLNFAVNSTAVSLGDINNDGALDTVQNDAFTGFSYIILGNGNGTYKAPQTVDGRFSSEYLQLVDLNNDGDLDIFGADPSTDQIFVMMGNGDGAFTALTLFAAGNSTNAADPSPDAAFSDINGDGMLDVIVTADTQNTVNVLFGNSNGSFTAPVAYDAGDGPSSVRLSDVNGDSTLDLVVASYDDDRLSILIGNANGTFNARTSMAAGNGAYSLEIADLNGDGVADIVSASQADNQLRVFIANSVPASQSAAVGAPLISFLSSSNISNVTGAKTTLDEMKALLDTLAKKRGGIGSFQSRLQVALSNLSTRSINYDQSASQIVDADLSTESARYTRLQILQQAASAVLAQANQQPAIALSLLR